MTALRRHSPSNGPAVAFTGLIPDHDHYRGSFAGRVHPLWADRWGREPNLKSSLLAVLTAAYDKPVTAPDVFGYIAGVAAHPAYTARFRADLVQPGLRIPITGEAALFQEAVELGREVVWLLCFGERFGDTAGGRPAGPPRLPSGEGPTIPKDGAIPTDPERMPDELDYDASKHRLIIGDGYIDNVPKTV